MPKENSLNDLLIWYIAPFEVTGHRYYKNEYPKVDDVVMVKVDKYVFIENSK